MNKFYSLNGNFWTGEFFLPFARFNGVYHIRKISHFKTRPAALSKNRKWTELNAKWFQGKQYIPNVWHIDMQASVAVFLLAWFGLATANEESDDEIHFTNSWAVHIDNGDLDSVNNIAEKHGFINQGQVGTSYGATDDLVKNAAIRTCSERVCFYKSVNLAKKIQRLIYLFCRVKRYNTSWDL